MKQQRDLVTKRAPVSVLDLPGMERWLSDMAARGLFLERQASSSFPFPLTTPVLFRRLRFRRDTPRPGRRYHLCPVKEWDSPPSQELLELYAAQPGKVLYGGPMMGTCVADLSQPILKNNNAVLAFSEKLARLPKKTNCIHCGRCVNACPLGLAAKDIVKAYENGNVELLQELNADLCMSCGTCSFVCPAKRPLAPSIALAKIMMKNGGKK